MTMDCNCDLRTKLVGDGCEVCNPKLAAELSAEAANLGAFELHDLYSEDGRHFFAKGWHDKQLFADKLTEWGEEGVTTEAVQHCYVRWSVGHTDDGPAQCLQAYKEPGRGRFKATYWDNLDL